MRWIPPRQLGITRGTKPIGLGPPYTALARHAKWRKHKCDDFMPLPAENILATDKHLRHGASMTDNMPLDNAPSPRAVRHAWARRRPEAMPIWTALHARLTERLDEATGPFPRVWQVDETILSPTWVAPLAAYDAILCPVWLTVIPDVPRVMGALVRALAPGGLFLANVLGPGSFEEFRQAWAQAGGFPQDTRHATAHVTPFADGPTWANLLHKTPLESPVVDIDRLTLTFADFQNLYANLRAHGMANLHPQRMQNLTGKSLFSAMEAAYCTAHIRTDGRLPVTLNLITLHGFKPRTGKINIFIETTEG